MRSSHLSPGMRHKPSIFILIISTLVLISLAWSLPGCSKIFPKKPTPTPTTRVTLPSATPTQTPQILPPALVETDPLPGAQIALKNPITFYFNQPMQHASVEGAVTGEPALSGSFKWRDDSTLTFTPDTSLLPGTSLTINIGTTAQSTKGMALLRPISLSYTTSAYLNLVQSLPEANASDVDPTSAVVAAFNQPVVPLGADPASLPVGFTLTPSTNGKGEWINTSTYIFYPAPALAGGAHYYVSINPDLTSTSGAPLESAPSWSFSTVLPRLVSVLPSDNADNVHLDTNVQLNFSYSMDTDSVQASFSLQTGDGNAVSGQSAWNENFTTFTFTPTSLLQRDAYYFILLGNQVYALGGTPLGELTSTTWHTVRDLSITGSHPSEGGVKISYDGLSLFLTSPVPTDHIGDYVTFTPKVPNMGAWFDDSQMSLSFYGNFDPDTDYILKVSPDLADLWGSRLGQAYTLHFRTGPLDPSVYFLYTSDTGFLTTQDKGILAQVTNVSALPITMGTLTIDDLVQMYGNNGYEYRQNFTPRDAENWTFHPDAPPNRSTSVTIPVSADGQSRSPGLYFMRLNLPDNYGYTNSSILAISHYQATLKLSPTEAFVWVVDLNTNAPASNIPVTVYDQSGSPLASGNTDVDGVFHNLITTYQDPYNGSFAILGQPGEDNFGFAMSYWSDGITPSDFDIQANYYPPKNYAYIYTDRPIYRPGDTVYFRFIVRQVTNGRYSLPDLSSYPLELYGPMDKVASFDMPLSAFGTGHGEYTLPPDILPGDYALDNLNDSAYGPFKVADYRKPEINLQVTFQSTDVLSGTSLVADVNARYFFDAPAGKLPIHWALYHQTAYFNIPNYQVGPVDTSWLNVFNYPNYMGGLGNSVAHGDSQLDANGLTTLNIPAPAASGRQQYILEVTLADESGLPVSARSSIYVNPAEYYIGVHPDAWSYRTDSPAGFNVLVTDWQGDPAGVQALSAKFQRVVWVRHDPSTDTMGYVFPTYVAEYTPIDSPDFTTSSDGTARLSFTPPEAGTYQLDVSGDGTLTQVIIWVGGTGQVIWPSLPNQRLRLVADQDTYKPGNTAQVFIPNPFGSTALGLLTVERGTVMRYQILHLEPGGSTIPLALSSDDAPNVYIAVTLLGQDDQGNPDFRQGYVNLTVDPSFEYLNVHLTSQPERTGPGEPVTFSLRITDANGAPVQGEFSLAVVDKAVLALAEPTVSNIISAFYGQQSLNVRTGISLAASGQRFRYMPGGMGGGGGGAAAESVTRENFPDTAYWDAQIVTDANGEATVSMSLPDSLTTWQVLVRGLTKDTLVGEAQLEVITTKDLLIRPVTPRFLVVGDHAQLSAVVQNNTSNALEGTATLQATGFVLDEPNNLTQPVSVPPNGRTRLEWWGTAADVASASLRFSVQAGDLQDAVLVSKGALPVLRYTAPQTFATSGILTNADPRLELVSLPVTFDANSGSLNVELDPSLAASMIDALDALENYPYNCTEQVLSRFLPNLVTYSTLQTFGIDSPDLKARLDRTLHQGLEHLLTLQNADGGWGWWQAEESDAYITSYVLFGLASTRDTGINVPDDAISKAVSYISTSMITSTQTNEAWILDRLAFENFALKKAGAGNLSSANQLYEVRDQLSPWAKGLLTLSLDLLSSSSTQVPTMISDLQATAIRSATGVHWEAATRDWRNMTSTLSNTAMVIYTLAQVEPASTLLPDAVNYLMSNRQSDGLWSSSYENAWILLAMDEVMKGTGELGSNYAFSASLNGTQIASGQAGSETQLNPVVASLPISNLYPHNPNALTIQRDAGTGRLYYTAALNVYRPVEDISPLDRGISVSRAYFMLGADLKTAAPVSVTKVGDTLTVRLAIVLTNDAYHFVVEDYIPAGAEILNTNLKTSQLGQTGEPGPLYDPRDPYSQGWGWWLFNPAQIYDDHISWTASYLPAGSYELTYTLTILQAGEYKLLPTRAWMFYFPEVQGNSAGGLLEIKP